jgi:hypothetical protein
MTTLAALLAFGCSATGSTSVADPPPPSAGHVLVYHSGLGAVLLVNGGLGGHSSPPSSARTTIWRWTGSEWTVLSDAGPPIRNLGGVAYDARRNRLVMYGGTHSQNLSYDDTWEWDQASGWQQKEVSGPGTRDHVEMVYDATRERVVLYGGQLPGNEFPRDTWTWDGTSWQQLHESGPAGRVHYGLVYDPGTQRTYLFGGSVPGSGRSGETWYLAAAGWTPAAGHRPTLPRATWRHVARRDPGGWVSRECRHVAATSHGHRLGFRKSGRPSRCALHDRDGL